MRISASAFAICKGASAIRRNKVGYEFGLDGLGVLVGCLSPCDEKLATIGELPNVAASPVSDRLAGSVTAILVKALAQAPPTRRASATLPDIHNLSLWDPCCPKARVVDCRILPLEPPGGAARAERRHPKRVANDYVDAGACRDFGRRK